MRNTHSILFQIACLVFQEIKTTKHEIYTDFTVTRSLDEWVVNAASTSILTMEVVVVPNWWCQIHCSVVSCKASCHQTSLSPTLAWAECWNPCTQQTWQESARSRVHHPPISCPWLTMIQCRTWMKLLSHLRLFVKPWHLKSQVDSKIQIHHIFKY